MKSIFQGRSASSLFSKLYPLFLLFLCIAAYGPFLTRLGFYWDDFPISWIASTMGGEGLARYFSTNRPVWGLFYRVTTAVFGSTPLVWHVFALLMRWVTGLALWALLRQIWREKTQFAAWAAALFVIYPGFSQQSIAFLYSHFFIVLTIFLLSLYFTVLSIRRPHRFWPLTVAALVLAPINLFSMEYFFLLELLRPVIIWLVLADCLPDRKPGLSGTALARAARLSLPYLAVFLGAAYWRSVLFGFHTYEPALASRLVSEPVQTILGLIPLVLRDVWLASGGAVIHAFTLPAAGEMTAAHMQRYWMITAAGGLIAALYLIISGKAAFSFRLRTWKLEQSWAWQPVALGILALFVAGGPFWLTDLPISLNFPNDRFTLSFMFGAVLAIAGLLVHIPLPNWSKAAALSVLIGFSIGLQYRNAVTYNLDWSSQRSLFWQMTWRMPGLEPGTALLTSELPLKYYTDNSLSAPLNWIYDPQNDPQRMKYIILYPSIRKSGSLKSFQQNQPIEHDYLATTFYGNTSQMVAFYYQPPGCLRVLDPEIEILNWMIPQYLRESLPFTSLDPIRAAPPENQPEPQLPAHIYGAEIAHNWCYYYQKADLARQLGDWETAAALGDQAFALGDYPNDPIERFPFIEAYAHTGNWERAASLSREAYEITHAMQQPLCRLWQRIDREAPPSEEKEAALPAIQAEFACSPD